MTSATALEGLAMLAGLTDNGEAGSFRALSENLPHLRTWIDELLDSTDRGLPTGAPPTTDDLVRALQRYDAMLKELLRYTRLYSEPLTQLLSRVWAGALRLLVYMIKSYHRYMRQTEHLQTQSATLLSERQTFEAASKVMREDFDMERTALRAKIRSQEAELDVLKGSQRILEAENGRLRSVIGEYITPSSFTDPVDVFLRGLEFNAQAVDEKYVDASRRTLKTLNGLDVSLDAVMTDVQKEQHRKRLLIIDLVKLINEQGFFEPVSTTITPPTSKSTSKVAAPDRIQRVVHSSVPLRPGAMVTKMNTQFVDMGIQADGKDLVGASSVDLIRGVNVTDYSSLGVAPLAPPNPYIMGSDQPYLLRRHMTSFPLVLRVPTEAWTCQCILAIYLDKIVSDKERAARGLRRLSMAHHTYDYFLRQYGLAAAADLQVAQLLKACEAHIKKLPRVELFAQQIGFQDKEEPPPMDLRDTDFILHVLRGLIEDGELCSDLDRIATQNNVAFPNVHIRPEIQRTAAIETVRKVLSEWLPDGVDDYCHKVRGMRTSEQTGCVDLDEYLEMLIEPWQTVRVNWEEHARFLFSEFATFYRVLRDANFAADDGTMACDTVLAEIPKAAAVDCNRRMLRFFQRTEEESNQSNQNVKDSICELMRFSDFQSCIRLIVPSISDQDIRRMFEEALELAHERVLRTLELMWTCYVDQASNYLSNYSCMNNYESSAEMAIRNNKTLGTNREFWVNSHTQISQWAKPYEPNVFRLQEVEIDAFVKVILEYDLFSNSPLIEFLTLPPKEVWHNTDIFYKQLELRQRTDAKTYIRSPKEPSGSGSREHSPTKSPNAPISPTVVFDEYK